MSLSDERMAAPFGGQAQSGDRATNLGDILERVLDKGLVIAGDIRVNLLDIELLTIKLRLVIASLETAKEVGIDWWTHDPWLRGDDRGAVDENARQQLPAASGQQSKQPKQTKQSKQSKQSEREVEQPEPQEIRRRGRQS